MAAELTAASPSGADDADEGLERDGQEGHVHQEERQGRAEGPVVGALELALDDVGDHLAVGTAQKVGGEIGADGGDEGDQHPRDDARHGQRYDDASEGGKVARPKIEARLQEGAIEPIQRRVERKHHEGQLDIDQSEHHGEVVVQQFEGLKRGQGMAEERTGVAGAVPGQPKAPVDVALVAQHGHQRIGADQEIGPERQHDEE